jgi:AcrR family transcriptional regulator
MNDTRLTKGQQTREQLIEAALHQFAANGYHGTSMRQIAEAAGLAVGGIYNHFASKEEILKAVILAYHPLNIVAPMLVELEGDSFESLLRTVAHGFYAALQARPELLNVLFIELFECKGEHLPELAQTLLPKMQAFAQRLQHLRPDLSPQPPLIVLRTFLGALLGFLVTELIFAKALPNKASMGSLDDMLDVMLTGLRSPIA